MGRAPIQHKMECAIRFRMALTVAFGKPPFAGSLSGGGDEGEGTVFDVPSGDLK